MKYKKLPLKKSNQPMPKKELRLYIALGVVLSFAGILSIIAINKIIEGVLG